jgi:plasmid stabilization system protein ParE
VDEEFAVLLFFFGISLTANVGLLISTFRAHRRLRRLEDHMFQLQQPQQEDRRVDQIEQTMDALSGQMDQLANGQEFLNRVLAERLDRWPRAQVEGSREVTPH